MRRYYDYQRALTVRRATSPEEREREGAAKAEMLERIVGEIKTVEGIG